MELPVLAAKRPFDPNDPDPCAGCGDCCRYVTAQIKSPRSRVDYDEIRWFLLHENIQVFIDDEGWYIEFATACRKLDGHRCGIYPDRPRVCSDYEVEHCTRYGDGDPHKHLFRTEAEYLAYLQKYRPYAYAWVMDPREEKTRAARAGKARPRQPALPVRAPAPRPAPAKSPLGRPRSTAHAS